MCMFDFLLQLTRSVPGPSAGSVNTMDYQEPSVDHSEMLTITSTGRVSIDEVDVSDDVTVPVVSAAVSADGLDHVFSTQRLQLPAVEQSMDEETAAAVALTANEVPASEKFAVEQPGLSESEELEQRPVATSGLNTDVGDHEHEAELASLGELQLEQLENVQVAIKVFTLLHVWTCSCVHLKLHLACAG